MAPGGRARSSKKSAALRQQKKGNSSKNHELASANSDLESSYPISLPIERLSLLTRDLMTLARVCLAVILVVAVVQLAHGQQQLHRPTLDGQLLAAASNNQLMPHHHHNTAAMFKDMSGPTSGKIQTLDVICGKNYMTVRAEFSAPFYGIVFSKGTYGHENCIYVKPNSGMTHAAFNVYYDQCGTKPDLQGKFYENTIVIQYGSDIIEAYDEAKRLRCEWFEAYEKPATFKPAIPVADLEVVEMNFQGDDIDCWMEIQEGTGPWSKEVSKIVPVGQPMTIVVAINDYNGQFDMRVKSCVAHDGVQQPISLTDEFGCVLRPKMLTPFIKVKNPAGHKKATVLSYSRFLAFKFPDSMNVQIQCTVEVCRHGCADACQRVPSLAATTIQPELSLTAKWPAAPNQPAIEAPRRPSPSASTDTLASDSMVHSESRHLTPAPQVPQFKPARVQFSQPRPSPINEPSFQGEEQRLSDPAARQSHLAETQFHPSTGSQRRTPHEPPVFGQHGMRRRPLEHHVSSPAASPSTTTTSTTTTTTELPATTSSVNVEDSRVGQPVGDSVETSMDPVVEEQPQGVKVQDEAQLAGQQQDTMASRADQTSDHKPEASQVKATVVQSSKAETSQESAIGGQQQAGDSVADQSSANNNEQANGSPQTSNLDNGRPSDEMAQFESGKQSSSNGQESQGSSLKTVEVEVPANEEPMRTLIASSVPSNSNGASDEPSNNYQFSSNRLSNNGDLNQQASSYLNRQLQSDGQAVDQTSAGYKLQSANQESSVIQPRESQTIERRHKPDESSIEAMLSSSSNIKSRFGARSQPQAAISQAADLTPSYNQRRGSDDRSVLIDRSDDSSANTDNSGPQVSGQSEAQPAVGQESSAVESSPKVGPQELSVGSDLGVDESSPAVSLESSGVGGKVKPVVGTEELASGPLQIEDRIGAPAPTGSLEDAIMRLQEQVPQTAALVSGQETAPKMEERSDKGQEEEPVSRSDSRDTIKAQASERISSQSQKPSQQQQQQQSQPFPNIMGQTKVIPDPGSSLNGRNPMLAQASNIEAVGQSVMPAGSSMDSQQQSSGSIVKNLMEAKPLVQQQAASLGQLEQQQQAAMMQLQQGKPVAQITNVPINIGFPQNQIPNLQQISQQMAMIQQQQLQKQEQQQQRPSTTSKPSRGRFSLLSPQAAIQAVASRFMPKAQQQQQPQPQQQQQPRQPQIPGVGLALSQEQQKMMQQEHVARYLASQQQPPSRFVQPPKAQSPGLFGRLSSAVSHLSPLQQQQQQQPPANQPQPLIRSRRSALMPSGKKGNGELGLTRSFMVVTGMDLAFMPNSSDTELPPILEGRRMGANLGDDESDVIYGVCMPVVSLTFVLTCAFWLLAFLVSFCVYMLKKQRREMRKADGSSQKQ